MRMSQRPTIYFPIESKTRELAGRLLIARFLLQCGFRAVVGFNDSVISGSGLLPRGIYFLKGMNAVQKRMASIFKRQGYRVMAIDEEALGISDRWFLTKDVDQEISPVLDMVFCQSDNQRKALLTQKGFTNQQLTVSGNPRIDLLMPPLKFALDKDANLIDERYGRFVLINTNSGSINNLWGDMRRYLGLLMEIGWFDPNNPDDRALVDDHLEHDRNNFEALRELIEALSKSRPDIAIVVRPHPSEASSTWEEFAKGVRNLQIVSDSEPTPWLQAAHVVVTTGCTTGFEAVLLGKPTISLVVQPNHVRHPSFFMANQISVICRSVSESVQLLQDHWDGKINLARLNKNARTTALNKHMKIDDGILASERIANAISKYGFIAPDDDRMIAIDPEQECHLRQIVKRVKWDKGSFSAEDIRAWMRIFDAHLGAGQPVQVRDVGWSTFELISSD